MRTLKPKITHTTRSLLAAQFNNQAIIRVEEIAKTLLGMEPNTAKRKAANFALPFPTFRLSDSQKSPWLVTFDELVKYVERKSCERAKLWQRMQA
ncbi:pyocin activator PrtN family protein [Shewanella schlegeliana]|uniref:Pyocin activator PrtN family protein n=1 Tax=Shewanella schlegeliana TaxID=190308 RepID=A0ABS1SWA2_9GAMM|nr:pyocin activator PrtN family protein [Shewanella schlegeliana]MBL4912821.1 pyocin activator PrtN family protein [Shewanella schlegeliana]MCL1109082.1 pyocin activator PrtN family protein [Shewanella schlegeliana]GIU23089.1 hypothetical protein TUM4433_04910 [Shewanella schlegeliana]